MGWFRRNEHDEEQLSAYLDGELSTRHVENVERHLSTCESCAALLEELRGIRSMLYALPAQTPRRSFVLGAEHARTPVRDAAPPSKRFSFVLAPAAALSVFVALVLVDVADFSSTSSDEDGGLFTTAIERQDFQDDESSAGSAGAVTAAQAPEAANPMAEDGAEATATKAGEAEVPATGSQDGVGGGIGGGIETPLGPPAAIGAPPESTPAPAEDTARSAGPAEEAPSPEPFAIEAPQESDDGGLSTLRVLQIVAAVAFLASGFYVFVWPRMSRVP